MHIMSSSGFEVVIVAIFPTKLCTSPVVGLYAVILATTLSPRFTEIELSFREIITFVNAVGHWVYIFMLGSPKQWNISFVYIVFGSLKPYVSAKRTIPWFKICPNVYVGDGVAENVSFLLGICMDNPGLGQMASNIPVVSASLRPE